MSAGQQREFRKEEDSQKLMLASGFRVYRV